MRFFMKLNYLLSFIALIHLSIQSAQTPTVTLFAHGILDTGKQIFKYMGKQGEPNIIITPPCATFNFSDACDFYGIKLCKFWNCSFGQDNDIKAFDSAYKKTITRLAQHNLIFVGMSRGASVILSYVALYQPENIRALVLESPFDTVQSSLDAAVKQVPALINCKTTRAMAAFILRNIARKYEPSALQPIDLVDRLPIDLPILLICSDEDKLVPVESTCNLYRKLKRTGHQHVYLLRLSKGKHSKLLHDSDGLRYALVVHAFYKKYALPHDPVLAAEGEQFLLDCTPENC